MWPPATGPSMTNPSTRPLALRTIIFASESDEMMGRNFGRFSFGGSPSQCSRGSNVNVSVRPRSSPSTSSFRLAGRPSAKASSAPGISRGMPAPMRT